MQRLLALPCLVAAALAVTVSVDVNANRAAFSNLVFGAQEASSAMLSSARYTVGRLGGNSFSRYDYENDKNNLASDYYYISNSPWVPAFSGSSGTTYSRYIEATRAAHAEPIVQINMIGWIPKSATQKQWSFSQSKYGAQQKNECSGGGSSYCSSDAGNGVLANGTQITWNDANDANKPVDEAYTEKRMRALVATYGTAANGGIKYIELDNEPHLWSSTHRDVRKTKLTYDEIWDLTVRHASVIKRVDPSAITMGPVAWGWCDYFYSDSDGCGHYGADYEKHGKIPMLQWYLMQNNKHYKETGVKLVDYLSIHYYPQGGEWGNSELATRFPSIKSLYDPNYQDQSWIKTSIRLIPRMKELIATYCPWMKLAITEYNWGATGTSNDFLTAALAQVEVLGVMAREGVELATRFPAPAVGTKVESSFMLYRNYDGKNGCVSGDSVKAESSSVDTVGSYAFFDEKQSKLWVVLINKASQATSTTVNVANVQSISSIATYTLSGSGSALAAGTVSPSGTSFTVPMGSLSATIAVVSVAGSTPAKSSSAAPVVTSSSVAPVVASSSAAVPVAQSCTLPAKLPAGATGMGTCSTSVASGASCAYQCSKDGYTPVSGKCVAGAWATEPSCDDSIGGAGNALASLAALSVCAVALSL
eukprot:m51a1_g3209 putative endoglucanase (648) ;mRNA; r:26246-28433